MPSRLVIGRASQRAVTRAGEEAARQAVLPSGGRGVCGAAGERNTQVQTAHLIETPPVFLFHFFISLLIYVFFCTLFDFVRFISIKHTLLTSNPCV